MIRYPEGSIFGTDVTDELRNEGFTALIFIRSSNDSVDDVKKYLKLAVAAGLMPVAWRLVKKLEK